MHHHKAKNLSQLQTELDEVKIDMAALHAIDRVMDRIERFRLEMHEELKGVRDDLSGIKEDVSSMDKRLVAVETRLGMLSRTGWIIVTGVGALLAHTVLLHFHLFN